ncbi:DUF4810 domain-containing protein [Neptunicella sp.]|uniref:DUF4810 domain-containing protein n=1 Tax=Neptunicella sp. TaxID=2125986 RepID=UPI003F691409
MKKLLLAAMLIVGVSGCKTTEPMYYYGDFNSAVYSYFKSNEVTVEEQITILQEVIQKAAAHSKPVAPGVHAHLGMLYFETGNNELGRQHLEQEEMLFPESKHYIDFLLKSSKEA